LFTFFGEAKIDSECGDFMLTVRTENSGDTAIVRCSGRLVAGKAAWSLYDTVISQQHKGMVLLDLTEVYRVDARGLGVLAFLKKWANEAGAKVELIPSKPVRELLELAGLSYELLRSSEIDHSVPNFPNRCFPGRRN
jgi:ABC-type transporter Mla MlaB component